jgi:hypothetical protein
LHGVADLLGRHPTLGFHLELWRCDCTRCQRARILPAASHPQRGGSSVRTTRWPDGSCGTTTASLDSGRRPWPCSARMRSWRIARPPAIPSVCRGVDWTGTMARVALLDL